METLRLNSDLQDQFFAIKREGSSCWRNGDWNGLRTNMQQAWEIIPEPKLQYDMSYLAAWMMCEALLQLRKFEELKTWIEIHNQADSNRLDSGEREFMEGRFLFAQGMLEETKKKFKTAYQKSDGRLFKPGTNNEHEPFFKDYKKLLDKDIIRPTEFDKMLDTAQKEIKDKNYPYALSLLYDCLNIESDNASVHFNKGVCHFELNEYDHAADSFTKAYMLNGEEMFKNEKPKYFDFLKTSIKTI